METKRFRKILLVEDDPGDAELTLAALEEHDLARRVVHVQDGEKGLDYLFRRGEFTTREGSDPLLVLLDLKMPKIGGLEVLKIIKTDDYLAIVPVVVLSSSREPADLVACYKHGVNAFVVKPVNFTEFRKTINRVVVFWATINEVPPPRRREENGLRSGSGVLLSNPHPCTSRKA